METKNEKPLPADYEWLIKDGEQIVNWDLDPLSRDLCEYVDMASVYGNGEEDAFGHDGCGQWTIQFKYRYWTGKFRMPFTKEEYYNNDDIIATVKGLGLDTEKFWFVLVFIYDYVESSFDETAEILQPASLQKAIKDLGERLEEDFSDQEIEITMKKGKKSVELLPVVKRAILQWLQKTYEQDCKGKRFPIYGADCIRVDHAEINSSYRIYRAVTMYRDLFSNLLGNKRPKQTDKSVSLNRLLLISRICYFYKFTKNDNFLYDDDSIKGIIKSCKGRIPPSKPACYW
mgnify:FL=1